MAVKLNILPTNTIIFASAQQSFIAKEYDEFCKCSTEFERCHFLPHQKIKKFNKKQIKSEKGLERLEQYNRHKNLKIHGIPFTQNKKTNKIVKKVANILNVKLENKDI